MTEVLLIFLNIKLGQDDTHKGVFNTRAAVLEYEKFWHLNIYEPSKQGLSDMVWC